MLFVETLYWIAHLITLNLIFDKQTKTVIHPYTHRIQNMSDKLAHYNGYAHE